MTHRTQLHQAEEHLHHDPATRPANWYTTAARAAHETHCDRCRALTETAAERAAAHGASMRRRDRRQIGLILDMSDSTSGTSRA